MPIEGLAQLIREVESHKERFETTRPNVSEASIGWHIEHIALVINQVIAAIEKSDPKSYRYRFSLVKIWILWSGKVPRGKVKAPQAVVPKEIPTKEAIEQHIEKAFQKVSILPKLDPNQFFRHPIFGDIKLKSAIRFLEVHTIHHLNIIKDIAKSA